LTFNYFSGIYYKWEVCIKSEDICGLKQFKNIDGIPAGIHIGVIHDLDYRISTADSSL